jgi:hypothetical protein
MRETQLLGGGETRDLNADQELLSANADLNAVFVREVVVDSFHGSD